MKSKQITLDLNYIEEEVNEKKTVYKNGVENPKYTDELQIDIFNDFNFNDETEEFEENGKYNIEIGGSNRALFKLGKALVNISCYQTIDESFHIHIDRVTNSEGEEKFNLKICKKERA